MAEEGAKDPDPNPKYLDDLEKGKIKMKIQYLVKFKVLYNFLWNGINANLCNAKEKIFVFARAALSKARNVKIN